ncbi:glutaredoxin family protein [Cystobacter fuscus]
MRSLGSRARGTARSLVLGLLAAGLLAATGARAQAPPGPVELEVFVREGCPRCEDAKQFLSRLQAERPGLQVRYRDVVREPEALARLEELAGQHQVKALGVPAFHVAGQLLIGFGGPETTGPQLLALLEGQAPGAPGAALCPVGAESLECPPGAPLDSIDAPWVGRVSLKDWGLPAFTFLIGLLDGFNPCAMWVLLFLLSLLVNLRSRRKMLAVAGTFVLTSGLAYFAFMAAWLNVFLYLGLSRVTQVVLGLVALVIGALNVKDFLAFKRGPSLSIPERAKPGLYARVRRLLQAKSLLPALGGVVVLAILVNLVELACTAGLPAVYTELLVLQRLPTWQYYAYLALYNVAYILDDSLMVLIAVVTLGHHKVQERAGRWLKLLSGSVMLLLGLLLLLRPRWLASWF